jgi:predicted small metal-binding protein
MPKQLRCSDAGFTCDAVVNADDDNAVMAQVADHAKDVHGMSDHDLEREAPRIRTLIRDV